MKNTTKRYLKYHFPEIEDNRALPVNYKDIQLYVGIESNENGKEKACPPEKKIVSGEYKIPKINLFPVFHKPISKCFIINVNESNDNFEQK